MMIRRLLLLAVLCSTLMMLFTSACVTVKAPERITIGDRSHDSSDNGSQHDRDHDEPDRDAEDDD